MFNQNQTFMKTLSLEKMEKIEGGKADCLGMFMAASEAFYNASENAVGSAGYNFYMGQFAAYNIAAADAGCYS